MLTLGEFIKANVDTLIVIFCFGFICIYIYSWWYMLSRNHCYKIDCGTCKCMDKKCKFYREPKKG